MSMATQPDACIRCGQCCIDNGLIPPAMTPEEGLSPWLNLLVGQLRKRIADDAEDWPCVFLADDCHGCLIYDDRPSLCQKFKCEENSNA